MKQTILEVEKTDFGNKVNFSKENLEKMNRYSLVVRIIMNVGFEILEKIIDVVYKGSVDVEEK